MFHLVERCCINSVPGHVIVTEHHALGVASCSRGEDEGAALVDGDPPQSGHQYLLLLVLAPAQQVRPTQHTRVGRSPTAYPTPSPTGYPTPSPSAYPTPSPPPTRPLP